MATYHALVRAKQDLCTRIEIEADDEDAALASAHERVLVDRWGDGVDWDRDRITIDRVVLTTDNRGLDV